MDILNSILLLVANSQEVPSVDYKLLMTLVSALSGAVIGGMITIWHKRKEINSLTKSIELQSKGLELQSQNLELQTKLFEETKINNELKIKAELVRLEDLNRQYQLSLQKHDFEHLSKILEFAGDSNEKVIMMKDFSKILEEYEPKIPSWINDFHEYQEYVVDHVYYQLDFIINKSSSLLTTYPNVFLNIHDDFKNVISEARYLNTQIVEYQSYSQEIDRDDIIDKLFDSLYSLHEIFIGLIEKMKEEFKELDAIKRDYVRNQFKLRNRE